MKVLHLHAGTLYGGVETFLATLARERALCPEMEQTFGMCFEQRLTKELRDAGVPVVMLGEARVSQPLSILAARRALKKLIQDQGRPDLAICHMSKPMWLFGAVLRRLRIPTVYYIHGPTNGKDLFDRLARRNGVRPDLMIGVSEHTVQNGLEMLYPGVSTATINYPMPWKADRYEIDDAGRKALRAEFQTGQNEVVILQAARMNEWKGQKNLLEGLSLMKDVPGWVHWLVGGAQLDSEKEYFESLQQMVRENGLEKRVHFLGQRSDVPRLMAASDVYCQANNESEGWSLSFTEAFSAGLPLITTDVGSASEFVSPDTGILTPRRDAPALAKALTALISDPDRRHQMGKAAQKRISQLCDTAQQIRKLHSVLTRVVASP